MKPTQLFKLAVITPIAVAMFIALAGCEFDHHGDDHDRGGFSNGAGHDGDHHDDHHDDDHH